MSNLIIMSGIPGSGKSTFIQNYNWNNTIEVLSTDNLRKIITGNESDLSQDDKVWKYIYDTLECPRPDTTYVVDATNLTFKRRTSYLRFRDKFESIGLYCLYVKLETAQKRNSERNRKVPRDVIDKMFKMYNDNLDISELLDAGYDEVRIINNEDSGGKVIGNINIDTVCDDSSDNSNSVVMLLYT